MGKLILGVILGAIAFLAFIILSKSKPEITDCRALGELECKTNSSCEPSYEYGISCGEGGCQEGQKFKECR